MCAALEVRLFGSLRIRHDGVLVDMCEAGKTQELLCYLLLHRQRCHPREVLADLLWSDASPVQSKKYLRQSLWQLRSMLDEHAEGAEGSVLLGESNRVGLNPEADLWLDVADFEAAFGRCQGVPAQNLDDRIALVLRGAVALYDGDLLEDWYQDWCLFERERLQNMYLLMLDKLVQYCESHQEYESGIEYAARILQCDRSHERAHRAMMRLQYVTGDRTAALHQFDRCVAALRDELGVVPARSTVTLYEQLRADDLGAVPDQTAGSAATPATTPSSLAEVVNRLESVGAALLDIQRQIRQLRRDIKSAGHLNGRS